MKESIFFKKGNKIYKVTQGASIENITDGKHEVVSVRELFHRKDNTYRIVLFSVNTKWPSETFDVEVVDEF